jgi:hypothetical protein
MRFAGTEAETLVELPNVVVREVPFQVSTVLEVNPVPLAPSVKPFPPTTADDGDKEVSVRPDVMVNGSVGGEFKPGTLTPTAAAPAEATREAGTAAVNWFALLNVVLSSDPFQVTVVPELNPEPVAVSEKDALPAIVVFGEILVRVTPGAVTLKGRVDVLWPPEVTPTAAVPAAIIRIAGTDAVSWFALTNVVVRALPFQVTTAFELKPEPVAVSVNAAPPATPVFGEMLVSDSPGWAMVKGRVPVFWLFDVTPTFAVPALATRFTGTVVVN